ncbi:hypothetical protein ACWGLE_35900 [Streptomyces sp. NPDC055897]
MTRAGRRLAARLVAAMVLALCAVLPTAPSASACSVGVGYKPSISLRDLRSHPTCSAATSATGAVVVAVLALGALAAAGVFVLRRAERQVHAEQGAEERQLHTGRAEGAVGGQRPELAAYFAATGVVPPTGERDRAA